MFIWVLAPCLVIAAHAAESSIRAMNMQLQPSDNDQEFQKRYAEHHKKHVPSPQELKSSFHDKQWAAMKKNHAHKMFLKSPEHKLQQIRQAHNEYQMVERTTRQNASTGSGLDEATSARCGDNIPLADLGFKNNAYTRGLFWSHSHEALLDVGPSMAVPGAGVTQKLADNGRSKVGSVTSAEKWEEIEPLVKVFKDGYSLIGCFKDQMYEFGDMHGDNSDQYREANINVSIVKYSEIVLKDSQKAMTPKTCYEFCRTVPDMVYFGVTGGRDCYCMPFYHKGASGTSNCDLPCPGDPILMCGGKVKSSIFEMHMCADTAGDLLYHAVKAEMELVYFYDTAFMTDKLGHHLTNGGKLLQKVAGSVGDSAASYLGKKALDEAASLFDPNTGWGVCRPNYRTLLNTYNDAKPLYDSDFTWAENLQQAEDSMAMMDNLRKKLNQCAKEAEGPILAVYPFFHDFMASLDETELQAKADKYQDSLIGFYPAIYMMKPDFPNEMSTCKGDLLGLPKPLPFSSCAEVCDQTHPTPTQPFLCAGFQYFQFMDGDKQIPLCFLFKKMEEVRTYRCKAFEGGLVLNQGNATKTFRANTTKTFRGAGKTQVQSSFKVDCEQVKTARKYSMLSCQSMFGKESSIVDECPEACETTMGAMETAVCMARHSLGNPRIKHRQVRRCFGEGKPTDQANADWRLQEFGVDASGGAGPLIEGEIVMAGSVVKEPYGFVWTPGPAGQR
jgi:hypothetical protein